MPDDSADDSAMDLDTMFARGDIVEFRKYVRDVRTQELTVLLARSHKLPAFENAVWSELYRRNKS